MKRRKHRKHRKASRRRHRAARAHHTARRTHRRQGRRRARKNPGMPIVLVNPSGGTHMKRGRRRSRRSHRRHGRRSRVHGYMRRRNPSSSWGRAAAATGIGALGGAVAYGIDFGASYAPVGPTAQTAIVGGAGLVTSLAVAKWADERAGAGIAGGTGFALVGRVREQIALASAAKGSAAGASSEGGAVRTIGGRRVRVTVGREGGAVYRDAGAIRQTGARSMAQSPMAAKSYREAAASRYIPGPIRFFGPRSWVYNTDSGAVVYKSAHNR